MNKSKIISLVGILFLSCGLKADILWTQETGWYAEGGLLADYLPVMNGESALDAMNLARNHQERGEFSKALSLYRSVAEGYSDSILAPEAVFQEGKIYRLQKRWNKSYATLQQVLTNYPEYSEFNKVIAEQFDIAVYLMEGARTRLFWKVPGFRDYSLAQDFFEGITSNAPYSEFAPSALMNIAIIAKDESDSDVAVEALDRLINSYPDHTLAADAYYMLAEINADMVDGAAYDQGSTREAMSYYEDFLILYSGSGQVGNAEVGLNKMREVNAQSKLYMADYYYFNKKNKNAALVFYNETITVAPNSESAKIAEKRIAQIKENIEVKRKKEKRFTIPKILKVPKLFKFNKSDDE